MRELIVVDLLACAEDVVSKANNFILVALTLEKAQLGAIVKTFFDRAERLRHDGLGCAEILLCLKGHITEKHANILSRNGSIIIKVVPEICKTQGDKVRE